MSVLEQRLSTAPESPAVAEKPAKNTYGQILKSSALIGSSSVLNVGFGIVRTKAMALLLGPMGVGLLGDYTAISDLVRTLAGMGVNTSGVRQIAEAAGTGDTQHLARTVIALRRVAVWSGALGALLLLIFCKPISRLTFMDDHHAGAVALLAIAVFFGDVSAGQGALVQGMRRIADLAKMSVLGAFYGTLFSIPIVYFYREQGVVPSLVCVAGMGILTSWWYARKVKVEPLPMKMGEVAKEASALLRMGVVFMVSTLMTMGVACLIRIIITRKFGIEGAGLYQSAWALGGLYIGFVLQAMGADFYPRLTAAAKNNPECNRLVNEQAEIGLLLAGPGVIGTLTFAPLVISLFYTAKFGPAVETFRWICLGMVLRVASWPMGFILLAKGERKLFFWSELVSNLVYVGLVWGGIHKFGLEGAGMAFFGLYVFYWVGIYMVVRRLSGFRWSQANRRLALLFVPTTAAVFAAWYVLPYWQGLILGGVATAICGIYSLRTLCSLIPLARLPQAARKLLTLFRLAPAGN
ncbi:MAG: polysaccharide biosynthesis protein [Pedosphaera sp.]|nr:polysaccharide biosynthesis protein [Pedosphaera sp.]